MKRMETVPLGSLKELLEWDPKSVTGGLKARQLNGWRNPEPDRPQTLVCHDMAGGYLDSDKYADGYWVTGDGSPYYMEHWWYMDIFVYFSHHFVTIPPVQWTNVAHEHGVLVLGTFITESESGAKIWSEMLNDASLALKCIENLTAIARVYNFDGWLLNVENEIEFEQLNDLRKFVADLTSSMRSVFGDRSRVIWYDSVIASSGRLAWQNELNALNKQFYDACDGFFANYNWNENSLKYTTCLVDPQRKSTIFFGVDCFGRGTFGGGQWTCDLGFEAARKRAFSVALFAPGWVYEKMDKPDFERNSKKFYQYLAKYLLPRPICHLPFKSNFNAGFSLDSQNKELKFNLSDQQLQCHWLCSNLNQITRNFDQNGVETGLCLRSNGLPLQLLITDIVIPANINLIVEASLFCGKSTKNKTLNVKLVVWIQYPDGQQKIVIDPLKCLGSVWTFVIGPSMKIVGVGFVSDDDEFCLKQMSINFDVNLSMSIFPKTDAKMLPGE